MQPESGAWSPYLVGALIGLLSMATFCFSNKPLSVSTAYARLAGMVGNLFSRSHAENLEFYQEGRYFLVARAGTGGVACEACASCMLVSPPTVIATRLRQSRD